MAVFIAEPVRRAAGGGIAPPPGYYEIVQETCRRYDVVFIADEVMCGMGRTGTNFAIEYWQAIPDIIVTVRDRRRLRAPGGGYRLKPPLPSLPRWDRQVRPLNTAVVLGNRISDKVP